MDPMIRPAPTPGALTRPVAASSQTREPMRSHRPPPGRRSDGRSGSSDATSSAVAGTSPSALPIAIARLRRRPGVDTRDIGPRILIASSSASLASHSASSVGASSAACGCHSGRALATGREFHGHTSWQMSQPYTRVPIASRTSPSGIVPALLDREIRDAAGARRAPRARRSRRWGTTAGTAGSCRTDRRLAASGSSGRLQMISPRNSQDPRSSLIRQVCLPIQPSPACCA